MIRLALALLALSVLPAQADCRAEWERLGELLVDNRIVTSAPRGVALTTQDGCRVTAPSLPDAGNMSVKAREMVWSGEGMARFSDDGLPPIALDLELTGMRFIPRLGDRRMSYLMEIQGFGEGIDLTLRARWDADAQRLNLSTLRLDFPGEDSLSFSATVEGVDLSDRAAMQMSAGRFAITRTVTVIRSERLFQEVLLMPLGMALLDPEGDPEAQVEKLKADALEVIADLPEASLPPDSRAALERLIADMPEPSGVLSVVMTADPGLGAARGMRLAADPDNLDAVLDGVVYDIDYVRR